MLGHFFASVRKQDGSLYEPDTLTSFQRSIDRHLSQSLHCTFSILRDAEFAPSREKLKAARKYLKSQGLGNKPKASEALESSEVERLWSEGGLGGGCPSQLQNTIWWLISTQMGTRGCDEHHKFRFGDFTIRADSEGHEFVEFSSERGTKTRSGETEKSTNADSRKFKPKMWATQQREDRCPVALFRKFIDNRPPEMCQPDSPFYLAINHNRKQGSFWYKKQPLGVNQIDKIMKTILKGTSVTGRKTNHSARKTMVEKLCRANVPDSTVMQLSGHKSVTSLNHYKKPSLEQQQSLSHLLSDYQCTETIQPNLQVPVAKNTSYDKQELFENKTFQPMQGTFSYGQFSNCTFNITFGTPASSTTETRRVKRARVLYDSSDED